MGPNKKLNGMANPFYKLVQTWLRLTANLRPEKDKSQRLARHFRKELLLIWG
jgi:hypothetical protein